jgi:TrmH family RNA methyltransferase
MTVIRSRDNARVRRWRDLARDARRRRGERRALIEGVHLLAEYLGRGGRPLAVLASEAARERGEVAALIRRAGTAPVVLADSVFRAVVDVESPTGIAAEIAIEEGPPGLGDSALCVFLEGIQDAGNVGAILRSAAAFGASDAVLSPGCADAWSPKVLRAAMGGHFRLRITQDAELARAIEAFGGNTVCAVPRGGTALHRADLSGRIGWVFGAEGAGISAALAARVPLHLTIPMPGGAESLNVGAAAAICLYETFRRRAAGEHEPG